MSTQNRRRVVEAAASTWAEDLIDISGRNTLLNFRHSRTTTLDLADSAADVLGRLLHGERVRLSDLFPDPDAILRARTAAKNIRGKARVVEEEQGIRPAFLIYGALSWTPPGGSSQGIPRPNAPVLLRPVEITPIDPTGSDFHLEAGDEIQINQVLLHLLRRSYGVTVDLSGVLPENGLTANGVDSGGSRVTGDADGGWVPPRVGDDNEPADTTASAADPRVFIDRALTQVEHVFSAIRAAAGRALPGLTVTKEFAVGLFNYEKLAMVDDLGRAHDLMAAHDIVAALAGDGRARDALATSGRDTPIRPPDEIAPVEEFIVLDADSSQHAAIEMVLAGRHLVIHGPPGTGKSQTIANLIASLAAHGKTALFVAEKRAAIDAVVDRLTDAGLADLVLDLHGGGTAKNKRLVARQLADTLEAARQTPPPDRQTRVRYGQLAEQRRTLIEHEQIMHTIRPPWDLNIFDAQSELAGLPDECTNDVRFTGSVLRDLGAAESRAVDSDIRRLADLGGLTLTPAVSPWAGARVRTSDQVRDLRDHVNTLLSSALPDADRLLSELITRTGLRQPAVVAEWEEIITLLDDLQQLLEHHVDEAITASADELAALVEATASRSWRRRNASGMSLGQRRTLRRRARALRRDRAFRRATLHAGVSAVVAITDRWRALAVDDRAPSAPPELAEAAASHQELLRRLAAVSAVLATARLEDMSADRAADVLRRMRDDPILQNLPEINDLLERLRGIGLGTLVDLLVAREADAETAAQTFRWTWLRSILDELALTERGFSGFRGDAHSRIAAKFVTTDSEHLQATTDRIRRLVAERLYLAMNAFPGQVPVLKTQARKKTRHLPIRDLVTKAGDLVLAARPCWAMSPLVVSQLLPAQRLFDVVIFDEASQVRPADAITSIIRGHQLVVAGDPHQLPPTTFFARFLAAGDEQAGGGSDGTGDDDSDSATNTGDFESILDVLQTLLPSRRLQWHYRSKDERLITFSNVHIYDNDLITFPGVLTGTPVEHVLVDGRLSPGQQAPAPEEVEAVVDLVLRHAEQRPTESLGVITMSDKQAQRIDAKLRAARAGRPDLTGFFSENPDGIRRPFFVKNIERVQGDERDSIILSIGYAKGVDGRLPHRFGPLNLDGGERRLNVAVTRARRRMTVVSSFSDYDMHPEKLRATGARLLRAYLEYARLGADLTGSGQATGIDLNPFEDDVLKALQEAGIRVVPQYGVSGCRIDFAAAHPEQPGRMVLAIEADGASYHSSQSARDRDRLRQEHLERLGWRFHRIWSTSWFRDPITELAKVQAAWKEAVTAVDSDAPARPTMPTPRTKPVGSTPVPPRRKGARPRLRARGTPIVQYTDSQLDALVRWIRSDELLRTEEELVEAARSELGYGRLGPVIRSRLTEAVRRTNVGNGTV
ncbi:AAA domain-containing protein [Frankia sp. Cj5]|uniref:AAA domain-containing protein n=2 Tax=unclassified Frankia TaxID=2632575 RepID=UPI001EF72CA6|nr:AAA domain-containing protein [Frankia sp. Cj5]